MRLIRWLVLGALLASPEVVLAQRASSVLTLKTSAPSATGAGAFVVETLGATAGSVLGFAVIYATADDCDVEDLGCNIGKAGLGIVTSTVGATLGAVLAGNMADTRPSGLGAALGAIAGAAAGLGMWHLFTEELDISNSPTVAIGAYSVTQGVLTALGSRIGRSLK